MTKSRSVFETWKRFLPRAFGGGAVALLLLVVVFTPNRTQRVPIKRVDQSTNRKQNSHRPGELTCAGGAEYPADVQLVPDAVVTTAGREAVEYHAEVDVHHGDAAGVAWDAAVVNDRGETIVALDKSSTRSKPGKTVVTNALLAQQLADGYYKIRVRVAVSPDTGPATVMEASQTIKIEGGKWREMDADQWRSESNARLAFAATGPSTKGVR